LADALSARLAVVHAVESLGGADDAAAPVRARLAEAGAPGELQLVEGSTAEAIMQAADRDGAELLVVGSRGRGHVRSALLGSVSRELASRSRCPVVIVPAGAHWGGRDGDADDGDPSVVCGVDGSDQALAAATLAGRLAAQLGVRLVVVHARQNLSALAAYPGASMSTPPATGQHDAVEQRATELVKEAGQAAGVSVVGMVEPGPPAEVLESVAGRESGRLIVIAARGVGGLRAAVLGSVAAELPVTATRPVVVISAPAAEAAAPSAS